MGRLTQNGFISGTTVLCHGLRILIQANDTSLLAQFTASLPPGWQTVSSTKSDFCYSFQFGGEANLSRACFGPEEIICSKSVDIVLSVVASHIECMVAENSPKFTFVHAGVIGWRGHAVLFPGRSCTGKSTLIRALLGLGAVYLSDEFAVIDSQGRVHPFAKSLSLRLPSGKISMHPDQIGAHVGTQPLTAGAIVVTRFSAHGIWSPTLISPGNAVLELLRNTVAVRANPVRSIAHMRNLVQSAIAIRSLRGEATTAAPSILEILDRYAKHNAKEILHDKLEAIHDSLSTCS